ncbi:RUN and FYVE domain-containing protein 2 [Harmonia axyridis]|uniref:RUN and FYVE domain-containing protein 2 n=1 Tax=Harmonia axyridis TaxID=115357 RepID=UPI001E27633A|nr:RUN and FYVE domain-containing protein 2 [Harmonia axyridis]
MSTDRESSPTSQRSFSFSNGENSPVGLLFRQWSNLSLLKTNGRKGQERNNSINPIAIERTNLVHISKLIIKELIEQSLRYGRTLDSDHVSLLHFFIIIEAVLRHRLRTRPKTIIGPKKELWDILQQIHKYAPEAKDITISVKELPNIKTSIGRVRAWLRIALMQKKLTDYLKILLDHKDELLEGCYESDSIMLSEDAIVIIGLLIGLNTIDCNLCLKEDDLDGPQGIIDFSLYLKPVSTLPEESNQEKDDVTSMLDQKNYIEELNEHLKATVSNLETKVESLTNDNKSLKENLAVAKNDLLALNQENNYLKEKVHQIATHNINVVEIVAPENLENVDSTEYKLKVQEEKTLRKEAEKELELQSALKAEMEVAMKLLEKDIHEKQDTIVSLRRQLDDIKVINLDMYKKLQGNEASIQHKTELITKLEAKSESMTDAIRILEEKYKESEIHRARIELRNKELDLQTIQSEEQTNCVEGDLKVEREWRIALQDSIEKDKEVISNLQKELSYMRIVAQKYTTLQKEYYTLKEKCLEQEQTMEELGKQLSTSKLQISDLKEEVNKNKADFTWEDDSAVTNCKTCNKEFSLTRRRHHCRNCGGIFCNACSDNSTYLPSSAKPVRVCDDCFLLVMGRNSVM